MKSQKLGKHLGVVEDPRTLAVGRYLPRRLPPLPASYDDARGLRFAMYGNDVHSDCLAAGAGNQERVFSHGKVAVSDSDVLAFYSLFNGGRDEGGYLLDMLNAWRKVGVGGHKILAFARIDLRKPEQIRYAIRYLDGACLGWALPTSARGKTRWTAHSGDVPGSWGGHYAPGVAYTKTGVSVATWGGRITATWGFIAECCDEAYAVVSPDQAAQEHMDIASLQADLAAIGSY